MIERGFEMKRRGRNGSEKFENKITFTSMLMNVKQQPAKRNRIRGPLNLDHRVLRSVFSFQCSQE